MATRSWWIVDRDHRRDHQAPRPASCVARACLFCYDRLFDQVDGGARPTRGALTSSRRAACSRTRPSRRA